MRALGVIGVSAAGFTKRNSESREAIIKLTAGVEAIASKLEDLHQDMKAEKVQPVRIDGKFTNG